MAETALGLHAPLAMSTSTRLHVLLALGAVIAIPCAIGCSASREDGETDGAEAYQTSDAASDVRGDAGLRGDADADGGRGDEGDASSTTTGSFVDPRDQQTYPTIRFGAKTWMAKNLAFAIAGSSFCYDDAPESCDEDGRLYTFAAAKVACPSGWHLGTDDDWKDLETAVGMPARDVNREGYTTVRGTDEGTTLKSKTGFGATMAGFRAGPSYDAKDDRTYFWTASTRGGDVWRRRIASAESSVYRFTNPPEGFAISVRCVAD